MSTKKILEVKNLKVDFEKTPILRGVNMEVYEGEFHLILGLNGSGKSTFGKTLLGHPRYTHTAGEIFFEEEEISDLQTHERAKKGIFLSHQSPPEISGVSAKDVLRAADKASEKKRPIFRFTKDLKNNLKISGLSEKFLKRNMNEGASGGERKKMEIASLLTLGAKLAFLDEIDSGLDVDALKVVSQGIQSFLSSGTTAVVLVSHSEGILKHVTPTHVHVFCGGRVIASGGMEIAEKVHSDGYESFMDCKECMNA